MLALLDKLKRIVATGDNFGRCLIWGLLIVVFLWLFYAKLTGYLLRPVVRRQIEKLTTAKVEIGSISFKGIRSVTIKPLIIESAHPQRQDSRILRAEKVYIKFSVPGILTLRPKIKKVTIENFVTNIQYDSDAAEWNLAALNIASSPQDAPDLPIIKLKKGRLGISRFANGLTEHITAVDLDANLIKIKGTDKYGFYILTDKSPNFGPARISGSWRHGSVGTVKINGDVMMGTTSVLGNSWAVKNLMLDLEYDRQDIRINRLNWEIGDKTIASFSGRVKDYRTMPEYNVKMRITDLLLAEHPTPNALVYSPELAEKLGPLRVILDKYKPQGLGDMDFEFSGPLKDPSKFKLTGTIGCKDVSVRYQKFPYLLEHMTGTLDLTERNAVLNNLKCSHNDVQLHINGYSKNIDGRTDADIQITSDNMMLGDDLYQALNTKQKWLWFTFTPSGLAKIDYRMKRSPSKGKDTRLVVDFLDADAIYQHFPYPLENITGRAVIDPNSILLENLVSRYDDNRIITLNGTVTETKTDRPRFRITIDAGDIPIDKTLKNALTAKQRQFYDYFETDALTDVKIKVFPNEVGRRLVEYIATVSIKEASVIYEKFPLLLTGANVNAVLTPDVIILEKMIATSGSAKLDIQGKIWPPTDERTTTGFLLSIDANDLEINDELLKAIPNGPRKIVDQLQPGGKINIHADLDIDATEPGRTKNKMVIECLGNSINFQRFPYPMENVTGTVTITPDEIKLENITAADPNTGTITLNGSIISDGSNINSGVVSLCARGIMLDGKLASALPPAAADYYRTISAAGKVDFDIDRLTFFTDSMNRKQVDFSSELKFSNCSFTSTQILTNLNALLTTDASYILGEGLLAGRANFRGDGLKIKGRFVDNINAEITYDPGDTTIACKDFFADCYGGKITGNIQLQRLKNGSVKYVLRLVFGRIELKEILAAGSDNQAAADGYIHGTAGGELNIQGILGRKNSTVGYFNADMAEMKLTKRSLLGKVLAAMQLNQPTDYIFSNMTIQAYIKNNKLIFERIYMTGESTVLSGSGFIDINSGNVNLYFTTFGQNVELEPSFLESLARGLGPAVVSVRVHGNIENPGIETITLPVIKHPLDIFGSGR